MPNFTSHQNRPYYLAVVIIWTCLFLICKSSYANDGSVFLFFYGMEIFFLGQIWVITCEWLYLSTVSKRRELVLILNRVFLFNCLTTLLGFILILPVSMIMSFLRPALESGSLLQIVDNMITKSFVGFGYSEPLEHAFDFAFLSLLFIVTYFISVYVEGYLLIKFNRRHKLLEEKHIMRHSFIFNGLSYAGLLLLFLYKATRPFATVSVMID